MFKCHFTDLNRFCAFVTIVGTMKWPMTGFVCNFYTVYHPLFTFENGLTRSKTFFSLFPPNLSSDSASSDRRKRRYIWTGNKTQKKTGKCCTNPLDIEWKRKIVLVAMWQRISFHAPPRHSITITVPVLPSSGVALLAASFFSFLLYMRILKFVCKQEVVKSFWYLMGSSLLFQYFYISLLYICSLFTNTLCKKNVHGFL